eukprot:4813492-Pyramimonas_sp.AAC.4
MPAVPGSAVSVYNNNPGSGRTGYWEIPPNNYNFYTEDEKYKPQELLDMLFTSRIIPSPELKQCATKKGLGKLAVNATDERS